MLKRVDSGDAAVAAGKRDVEIRRSLVLDNPASIPYGVALSQSERKLGGVQLAFGHIDDAFESFRRSCAVLEPLAARDRTDPSLLSTLALGRQRVASQLIQQQRNEEGLQEYQRH